MKRIQLASAMRGLFLYGRVAKKLGVDPSYVSRVAPVSAVAEIEAELEQQVAMILSAMTKTRR
jgi:hypothetical protein